MQEFPGTGRTCPYCRNRVMFYDKNSRNYRCYLCESTFTRPVGGAFGDGTAIILIILMVAITVVLAAVLYMWVQSFKPAIYIYTPEERKERVRLRTKGIITKRIPFRAGIRQLIWDDLLVKDGRIHDREGIHDYLFYEAKNPVPEVNRAGWTLRRSDGIIYWNGMRTDLDGLKSEFTSILTRYGLFDNEVSDFIEYWLGADELLFFDENDFSYGVLPIPLEEINSLFELETELEYPEYIRVQFLVKEIDIGVELDEPEFPEIVRDEYALHEWGVMKG